MGSSLDDRREALAGLATQFLIGGPVALLLASLAAYWAAGSALRPVEAMRRRAATISAGGPDERLPVSPANDELRRLGETLNEMLARLEVGIERERRFTDDAAHELRTPLALHRAELDSRCATRTRTPRSCAARSPRRSPRSTAWCSWRRTCWWSHARTVGGSRSRRSGYAPATC